jgi:ketosteroid isomerase-like protein
MKTQLFSLLGLMVISMIACTPKETNSDDQKLVNSLATLSSEAFNSNDVNRILGLFTDDAIFLNGVVKISGVDSLRKSFSYMFQHSSNFRYYPALYSVKQDMVFIEGLFTFDWNMNGVVSHAKGVMREVFIKQPDNSWKITYSEENHGDILE